MSKEFKYIVTDKGVKIKEYVGTGKEVVIPSEIDGMPVTSIGGYSFSSSKFVKSVTIPDSVTEICLFAFSKCTCLTSVTIGNSVQIIEWSAFSGCISLKSVTIPNSVKFIGDKAFGYFYMDMKKMTDFTICGYKDSVAQHYAENYGFDFVNVSNK